MIRQVLVVALLCLQSCSNPVPAQMVQGRWKMPDDQAASLGLGRIPMLRMEADGNLFAECLPFRQMDQSLRCLDGPGNWNGVEGRDRDVEVRIVLGDTLFSTVLFFPPDHADRVIIPQDPDAGKIPLYFTRIR